ncbi:MAG: DUF5615 family PIN-like protein [Acidobacteria bacterium]|nr:DUF5615 family PIN-like protein [Acidobacteriota bacterium]
MKLLLDVNLPASLADELQRSGVEASSWLQLGDQSAGDLEIVTFASANGFTIVTKDLDFGEILALNRQTSPSVVLVRIRDTLLADLSVRLVGLVRAEGEALSQGVLVTMEESSTRIRFLPIL